jgi:hypothetical protein
MEEMKKSVKAALESESRFIEAATKAEPPQSKSYQRIADGYRSVARNLIAEMNVEALSDGSAKRFRALDPKK